MMNTLRCALRSMWLVLAIGLVACSHIVPMAGTVHDQDGYTVARHLQERYDDQRASCTKYAGDPNPLPALLCSGLLMRFVQRGPGFYVWNPNPNSKTPSGVSFTWQRKGSAFLSTPWGYPDGFIILPHFYADLPGDGYTQLVVLCAFAFDGATNDRTGGDGTGCGVYPGVANSGPCQDQGVTSASTWLAKFRSVPSRYANQCGFNIKPGKANAYAAFASIPGIRQALSNEASLQTEVKIATWRQNDTHLPLEAFFYVTGSAGLASARLNQQDFNRATGRWVPVIRYRGPTSVSGPASFTYVPADQAIP